MFGLNQNRFNEKFSPESKELISRSREVAIAMGYDYISTLHFFIADCKIESSFSIKRFAFKDDESFINFYNNHLAGNALFINSSSLRLTLETEMTLRYAVSEKTCYPDKYVQPHHIFLAAVKYEKSIVRSIFKSNEGLSQRLENYYISIGLLQKEKINKGIRYKLSRVWARHQN